MIFGQTQQGAVNTAVVTFLGVAFIVAGSLITIWEEDQMAYIKRDLKDWDKVSKKNEEIQEERKKFPERYPKPLGPTYRLGSKALDRTKALKSSSGTSTRRRFGMSLREFYTERAMGHTIFSAWGRKPVQGGT